MSSPTENVPIRPMRLKVLYTFDAECKNNCLARWPEVLEVQTAFVDDLTQIGVVDLKTCLQALASSSPELFSQDAVDYTIYAYDYSEEGTPLSGQGMLSSVFNSNTQNGLADASTKFVTGRVTKNVFGLFTGNGQETLEVKLRLLPVAKQIRERSLTRQSSKYDFRASNPQDLDGHRWSNLPSNENGSLYPQQSTGSASPVDRTGLDNMQRKLHEGSVPREFSANRSSESLHVPSNSRPGSRSGTPGHAQPFNPPARQSFSHPSRPSSRASVRAVSQPMIHKRRESFNSGYYSGDEVQLEEGPARKRAKVTQVGAPSKSDLNIERQPESLRMVASTASSVRVHRPVAVAPAISNLQGNIFAEEPVRPPTPVPGAKKSGNRRQQTAPSSLRRGSQQFLPSDMSYPGQAPTDAIDISATSPGFIKVASVSSTPANMPSSPPVATNYGSTPSSPMLPPPPPQQHDSGFMSEFPDMVDDADMFGGYLLDDSHNDFQLQPTIEGSAPMEMYNHFTPVFGEGNNVVEETAKVTLPPPPKPSSQPTSSKRPLSRAQTSMPAVRPGMSSPKLAPAPYPRARQLGEEMAAQPSLPPVAASDPVGRHLQRSNTWSGDMSDAPMSDAPAGEVGRAKSVSKKKVGREQTKARCENAVANNAMPPYCDNCGTIDTPAWRRVFARTLPGHLYDSVELWPETPGAFVWKQVVEEAEDGTIAMFRAYKLTKSSEDKGDEWANVVLCNPCGLWFHKNKCMRPQEKWMRNPKDPNQKKKRAYRPKSKRVAAKKGQDDDSKSDAQEQGSEGSSPVDGITEAELKIEDDRQRPNGGMTEPELPPMHRRATSAEPTTTATNAAHAQHPPAGMETRATRSSPVHHEGSHSHPLQVDPTPKPLRRQLFPSPTNKTHVKSPATSVKDNSSKPLSELPNFCRRSPRLNKSMDVLNPHPRTPEQDQKENQVSGWADDDDLNNLFNDDEDGFQLPPQTPTPTRRSDRLLLKTPNKTPSHTQLRTPGAHLSPTAYRASQNVKTPRKDFIMGSNRTVEEMTPFTRMIHEELIKENAETKRFAEESQTRNSENPPAQQSDLDFPSLPSVNGMSPMSQQLASISNFDFSGINADFPDMFRPDQPAMGSPPGGYYDFLNEDDVNPALSGTQWARLGDANVPAADKENMLAVQRSPVLRRSPRKNRSG